MCSTLASEVPLINTVPLSSTPPHFIFLIDFFTTSDCLLSACPVSSAAKPSKAVSITPFGNKTWEEEEHGRRTKDGSEPPATPFFVKWRLCTRNFIYFLSICFRESEEKHSSARLMHRNSDGSVDTNSIWNLKLEPAGPFVLRRSGATRRTTKTHRDTHSQCRRLGWGCLSHLLQSSK